MFEKHYLPAANNTPSKEKGPDSVPPVAIGRDNLIMMRDPVLIPPLNGGRVVDTEDINILDFEVGR